MSSSDGAPGFRVLQGEMLYLIPDITLQGPFALFFFGELRTEASRRGTITGDSDYSSAQ